MSFQSTLPRGERRYYCFISIPFIVFQSTLPRGERPTCARTHARTHKCFNPRSHEGSDKAAGNLRAAVKVSIHAPTRGATTKHGKQKRAKAFQSTLPRGERPFIDNYPISQRAFQSTLPRGERHELSCKTRCKQMFQSTLPRGERLIYHFIYHIKKLFQSTLPRGERRARACTYTRTHIVSIHAPTRGATLSEVAEGITASVSIHAPTRGATYIYIIYYFRNKFQSTLPRGERLIALKTPPNLSCFNPRSHEGSDSILLST